MALTDIGVMREKSGRGSDVDIADVCSISALWHPKRPPVKKINWYPSQVFPNGDVPY